MYTFSYFYACKYTLYVILLNFNASELNYVYAGCANINIHWQEVYRIERETCKNLKINTRARIQIFLFESFMKCRTVLRFLFRLGSSRQWTLIRTPKFFRVKNMSYITNFFLKNK